MRDAKQLKTVDFERNFEVIHSIEKMHAGAAQRAAVGCDAGADSCGATKGGGRSLAHTCTLRKGKGHARPSQALP